MTQKQPINFNAVVSIGRNCQGGELPLEQWSDFVREAEFVMESLGEVVFSGEGGGVWEGEYEDAYTWIVAIPNMEAALALCSAASFLAADFNQEVIAVTFGTPIFCKALKRREVGA